MLEVIHHSHAPIAATRIAILTRYLFIASDSFPSSAAAQGDEETKKENPDEQSEALT